jgi:Ceramidase
VQDGRIIPLFFLALTSLLAVFAMNPIGQDPSYHMFADRRQFLGIPNFANVVSNFPFLLIGFFGLRLCCHKQTTGAKLSWMVVFVSIALVALGSAYYHWRPGDEALFWDRLPMTTGFMGLVVAVASEHTDRKIEVLALPFALALGIGSLLGSLRRPSLLWVDPIHFARCHCGHFGIVSGRLFAPLFSCRGGWLLPHCEIRGDI